MSIPQKCPLCAGELAAGVLVDRGHYDRAREGKWVDGELRVGFWGGIKSKVHRVTGLRCQACGHVLLFARPLV